MDKYYTPCVTRDHHLDHSLGTGSYHQMLHIIRYNPFAFGFLECGTRKFEGFCRAALEDAITDNDGLCKDFLQALATDCAANATWTNGHEQLTMMKEACEDLCGARRSSLFHHHSKL